MVLDALLCHVLSCGSTCELCVRINLQLCGELQLHRLAELIKSNLPVQQSFACGRHSLPEHPASCAYVLSRAHSTRCFVN